MIPVHTCPLSSPCRPPTPASAAAAAPGAGCRAAAAVATPRLRPAPPPAPPPAAGASPTGRAEWCPRRPAPAGCAIAMLQGRLPRARLGNARAALEGRRSIVYSGDATLTRLGRIAPYGPPLMQLCGAGNGDCRRW
eukprot:110402-Chlamydomonas_euryale.AAC.3